MKILLDTHAALWWVAGDRRFPAERFAMVADRRNQILISAVVVWEAAIKRSLDKLDAPVDLAAEFVSFGASALPVTLEHAAAVAELPWHHRDPFDRLLVAQATIEDAVVVSRDPAFRDYDVRVAW